jgi:hypothetical protein
MKSKIKFILPVLSLISYLLSPISISAQSATSGAETSAVEVLRKKIEEKVEGEATEEAIQKEKRGFFGKISDLFNQTIVLDTEKGKKTAKIDEETSIIDQDRKKIDFKDLAIDSFLIAMGYSEDEEKLTTKRIVISPELKEINRIAKIGRVTKASQSRLSLKTLKDNSPWEIILTPSTKISQKIDGEEEEADADQIEEEALIVVAGTSEEEGEIKASRIRLLSTLSTSPSPSPEPEED